MGTLLRLAVGFGLMVSVGAAERPDAAADASATPSPEAAVLAAARAVDIEYKRTFTLLVEDLTSADVDLRLRAVRALGRMSDPAAIPDLMPFLDAANRTPAEIIAGIAALAELQATVASSGIQKLVSHKDESIRTAAHNGLSRLNGITVADYMGRAADQVDPLRASSGTNLGTLVHAEAAPVLVRGLTYDPNPHIRRMCAIGLGRIGDVANAPAITDGLTDADPGVRRYCAEALVKLKYTAAIPNLLMALEADIATPDIARCLRLLSGQDFGYHPHAGRIERQAAIERGFAWWAVNAKTLR